jgi:hypothetical protein
MEYEKALSEIQGIEWPKVDPRDIILLIGSSAFEFMVSKKQALSIYPGDPFLRRIADKDDQWNFLRDSIKGARVDPNFSVVRATSIYFFAVDNMRDEERALTVFSREEEFSPIFSKIRESHKWEEAGFGFFGRYLDLRVSQATEKWGTSHLAKNFPGYRKALNEFYNIKLEFYKSVQ